MERIPVVGKLQIVAFPGSVGGDRLLPTRFVELQEFETSLADGILKLQACARCNRLRYPIAPVCPYCHSAVAAWHELSGHGSVHSWIRYYRTYAQEFEALTPYVVLTVQLDEGPRVYGRFVSSTEPRAGLRVIAIVELWPSARYVLAFVPDPSKQ